MYYITTAIDYTNGAPHIGHAYEKVLADVLARWHRMCGEEVFFLTGVDQHGQKVQQKVKSAIENMTGLNCTDVNIRIASVDMNKQK